MTARLSTLLQRYPLLAGFILMFAFTWPLDLGLAAQSRGLLPFHIPEPLGIFVGYGFVVATLIIVGVTEGKGGIRALLRRFLIWRVGLGWYGVVLFGFPAINLLAIGLHVLLGGRVPDFNAPFARQLAGPSMNLWLFAAIFFLFDVFANGEEIGWRAMPSPACRRATAL